MCANKSRYHGSHGVAHGTSSVMESHFIGKPFNYDHAKVIALQAHKDANPKAKCSKGCIEAQLDAFYGKDGRKRCETPGRKQPLTPKQRRDALKRNTDFP